MRGQRLPSHFKIRSYKRWIVFSVLSVTIAVFIVSSVGSGLTHFTRQQSQEKILVVTPTQVHETLEFKQHPGRSDALSSVKHSIEAPSNVAFRKIIWQTAKSHYGAPEGGVRLFNTWTDLNPSWDHILWDDEEVDQFVSRHYNSSVLEGFRALPLGVMRADVFRYMVIHEIGGVYVDADTECLKPVEAWVHPECNFTVALENDLHFCQWAIAGVPRHGALGKVLQYVLDQVVSRRYDTQYEHFVHASTGPGIFSDALRVYFQSIGFQIGGPTDKDLESFLERERETLRQHGVCMLSREEIEKVLVNRYSSTAEDLKSSTWVSWKDEASKFQTSGSR